MALTESQQKLKRGDEAKEHTMDENISKMMEGEEIPDELKSSMGCSMKWK